MTGLATIPLWIAIPVACLVVVGSSLTLLGTIGLVQLKSFYDRLHAPTLGTSLGTGAIVLGSILLFSWQEGRAILHDIVIAAFVTITTPVTLMLLGRAALHRDRIEKSILVPDTKADPGRSRPE